MLSVYIIIILIAFFPLTAVQSNAVDVGLSCEDNENFVFTLDNGNNQGCSWIDANANKVDDRQVKYCARNVEGGGMIGAFCPKACDNCGPLPSLETFQNPTTPATATTAPTQSPTKNPTYSPATNIPTKNPTYSPTNIPTMKPTYTQESPSVAPSEQEPTINPTDMPTATCVNSDSFSIDGFDCNDIRYRTQDYCQGTSTISQSVRDNCPVSCGLCCRDNESFTFSLDNGKNQGCSWIDSNSNKVNDRRAKYCNRNIPGVGMIGTFCPEACDNCGPLESPSVAPSEEPSTIPTEFPTSHSTGNPSHEPTDVPSSTPSKHPSHDPTAVPSQIPTSNNPTHDPTTIPTNTPEIPSSIPSKNPSYAPTVVVTTEDIGSPTANPTADQSSIIVATTCFVEKVPGQGEFEIPCEDIDNTYFETNATSFVEGRRLVSSSNITSDFYLRDIKLIFDIENTSGDVHEINSFIATLKGISSVLIGSNDNVTVEPKSSAAFEEFFLADLSDHSTTSLILKTVVIVTRSKESKTHTFAFPADFTIMTP